MKWKRACLAKTVTTCWRLHLLPHVLVSGHCHWIQRGHLGTQHPQYAWMLEKVPKAFTLTTELQQIACKWQNSTQVTWRVFDRQFIVWPACCRVTCFTLFHQPVRFIGYFPPFTARNCPPWTKHFFPFCRDRAWFIHRTDTLYTCKGITLQGSEPWKRRSFTSPTWIEWVSLKQRT